MRFIHVSDVNLACDDFENRLNVRPSEDHRRDFRRILTKCREEELDLLFITGNLFAGTPDEAALADLDEELACLEKTKVFYLVGPNEYCQDTAPIETYSFRSAITVFTGNSIQRVYLPKLNAEVLGVGYSEKTWNRVEPKELERGKKGAAQFLLLPMLRDGVTALPFDYVGVGGGERTAGEMIKGVYSPGSLEPKDFTAESRHGYFLGQLSVSGRRVSEPFVRFMEGASREYVLITEDVTREMTLEDVRSSLEKKIREAGTEHLYRIRLRGQASYTLSFGADTLLSLPGVTEIDNETNRLETLRRLEEARSDDAVGRFLRDLLERPETEARDRTIFYGLDALFEAEKEDGSNGHS